MSEALELPAIEPGFINETAGAPSWPGGSMDNALALALVEAAGQEGIDFQPGPTGPKKFWNEHRSELMRTAVLAGILLILALGGLIVDVYNRQQRLDLLNRQLAAVFSETFPEVTTVVDPLQQMRIKAQETRRAAGSKPGAGTRLPAIDILRQLSAGIPKEIDVGLGQVMIGPESVLVTGSTDGFDSVDRIKSGLGLVEGFRSVGITSATVDKNGGRVRFRVKIDL